MACIIVYKGKEYSEENFLKYYNENTQEFEGDMLQTPDVVSSVASAPTIGKVKEFLKRIGVDIKEVDDIVVGGVKTDANGVARIMQQLVEVVNGKEDVALTEEAMHFAVNLLERYNPSLYKQMFNKIGQYDIYHSTFDTYREVYTKEGKPDIVKIKQEAIAKLLTEQFILLNEGVTEKPELLQASRTFWQKVKEWLLDLFNKSDYNPFEIAAQEIDTLSGDVTGEEEFLQATGPSTNAEDFKNKLTEKIKKFNVQKIIDDKAVDEEERNFYKATINGKDVKPDRTTEYAKRENLRRNGGRDYLANATAEQKKQYTAKADEGTRGHNDLENIIKDSLALDGTLKEEKDIVLSKAPLSKQPVYDTLRKFLLGDVANGIPSFLRQFPAGTKFLTEQLIFNEKAGATGRAGTMDLVVILPDGSKKIYDWKFMTYTNGKLDQAPQKKAQHALQLGDYKRTLREAYGEKNVELFTVPIAATYEEPKKGTNTLPFIKSVQFGNINTREEKNTFLLPVIPADQSSGNKTVDELVKSLQSLYKRLYNKVVGPDGKFAKNQQLNQLSIAIRNLQVAINFDPIAAQAKTFQQGIERAITKYEAIDFKSLSPEEKSSLIEELIHLDKSASTYANADKAFLAEYGDNNLSEPQKKVLDALRLIASTVDDSREKIQGIVNRYVVDLADMHGITNILSPEKEVDGVVNSFIESGSMPQRTLRLLTKLVVEARKGDDRRINKQVEDFGKLYEALQNSSGGNNLLDIIGDRKTMQLKTKVKKQFWIDYQKAKEDKNKKFILANIDKGKYDAIVKEKLEQRKKEYADTVYSTDDAEDRKIRESKIFQIENALLIDRDTFNGYDHFDFDSAFKKSFKEEDHISDEFVELRKNPAALAMWEFITGLNKKAHDMGYLGQRGYMKFLPLIQGTIVERLAQADNILRESRAIGSDLFTVQVNEQQTFGKVDPETNQQIKAIPKLFTSTDKQTNELSQDLLKIIPLYIKAITQYETSKDLEMTALAIHKVEQAKGHFEVSGGNIIFEAGEPKVFKGNEKNAEVVEAMIDDAIYGIKQDNTTAFDVAIGKIARGTDEQKEQAKVSAKKTLQETNKWTQGLAVGLKLLVAIPNYAGAHFQATINAGNYYKAKEYASNHAKVIGSVFTGKEGNVMKGLIDLIIPLNEDVVKLGQRKIAKKQSASKYLSTWTFQDVLMSSNQLPDMSHQLTNAYSWIENSGVIDGKIVNLRQHLKAQDRTRYKESYEKRRELEGTFEDRLTTLKKQNLLNTAKYDADGYMTIPGVTEAEIDAYRARVIEFGRNITGQMDYDNKASYRRNIIVSSFMMFKNWIPKQVALRTLDIQKNTFQGDWEYGRTRLFIKTLSHLGLKNIAQISDIIKGTDRGLEIMNELLEQKKEDYYKKTGQILEITDEEFYDLMRKEIGNQFKELAILFSLIGLVMAAKLAAPDDDDDDLTKNRYKFWAKAVNKISDELFFYYSPTSTESITRGSIVPSLGILTKAGRFMGSFGSEMQGHITGDQDVIDKEHPLKYFLNMVPVASQFQNELYPLIDPEGAKEMGIRVSAEARAMR